MRFLFLALFMFLATSVSGQEFERQPAPENAQQERASEPAEKNGSISVEAAPADRNSLDAESDHKVEDHSFNHDVRDTQFNQSFWKLEDNMAQAVMAWATVAAVLFSAGATFFLWLTLRETRSIGRAQVRSYIQLDNIDAAYSREASGTEIRIFVYWINTGLSPPRNLTWAIDHCVGPVGDDFDFMLSPTATTGRAVLGAGQRTKDVSHVAERSRELDGFDRGKVPITLFGYVEYNDVFPKTPRHRTEFCVELWRTKGVVIQNYTSNRHNGADEDCLNRSATI